MIKNIGTEDKNETQDYGQPLGDWIACRQTGVDGSYQVKCKPGIGPLF